MKSLRPLKVVRDDTPLPGVFDTLWDAKAGRDLDLEGFVADSDRVKVRMLLAEYGFDANEWYGRKEAK